MWDNAYLWLKALHLISLIAWMAAQLYLPRLFVYHAGVAPGSDADRMLQTMERRLLRAIMNPAMIATFLFGGALVYLRSPDIWHEGWFHAKLLLVLLMTAHHGVMARCRKRFAIGANSHSQKFYRILNEVPAVLMIGIVVLVILKPF